MPSEIRSIGPTIRRLAKGTIDLVRWRAPVQLLKYATRTVWFKNVNTGYPVAMASARCVAAVLLLATSTPPPQTDLPPRRGSTDNNGVCEDAMLCCCVSCSCKQAGVCGVGGKNDPSPGPGGP
jgi:hypothetical protein